MIKPPKRYLARLSAIFVISVLAIILSIALVDLLSSGNDRPVSRGFTALAAPDGQALFEQKCKPCHTIGGGRTVGPDIKGISGVREEAWLIRFVSAPDQMIAQGDPIAKELLTEFGLPMPNLGVSEDEAKAILSYIESQSGGKPLASETSPANPLPPTSPGETLASVSDGKRLFTGQTPFKNGGPPCLICHNTSVLGIIGGGTTAKDLTTSYTTLGETGLVAILKSTPFPMMKEIYSVKPLTDSEIANLAAFLKETSTAPVSSSQNPSIFFIISITASLLGIVVVQFLWRGRLSGVRRQLVKGGSK